MAFEGVRHLGVTESEHVARCGIGRAARDLTDRLSARVGEIIPDRSGAFDRLEPHQAARKLAAVLERAHDLLAEVAALVERHRQALEAGLLRVRALTEVEAEQ